MGESNGNGNGKQRTNKGWANLIPCKPGETRNPHGRPRKASLRLAYLRMLSRPVDESDPNSRSFAEAIAEAIGDKALAGDVKAAKELRETTLGSRLNIKQRTTILPVEQDQIAIDRESTLADLAGRSIGHPQGNGSNGNGSRGPTGG